MSTRPQRRNRRQDWRARFWSKVDVTGDCWLWTATTRDGYGRFWLDYEFKSAHRVAFELKSGPIPVGLVIDHLCGVRNCVNPAHLDTTTSADNVRRAARPTDRCGRGHELTPANTYVQAAGYKKCRTCRRELRRRHDAAVKVGA